MVLMSFREMCVCVFSLSLSLIIIFSFGSSSFLLFRNPELI